MTKTQTMTSVAAVLLAIVGISYYCTITKTLRPTTSPAWDMPRYFYTLGFPFVAADNIAKRGKPLP